MTRLTYVLILFFTFVLAIAVAWHINKIIVTSVPLVPPRKASSIYIISLNQYEDYKDRDIWVMQYSIDGRTELVTFARSEQAGEFVEYLRGVGVVKGVAE